MNRSGLLFGQPVALYALCCAVGACAGETGAVDPTDRARPQATGSGGVSGSGGSFDATGGTSGSGGAVGSGGTSGSGGAVGSGGTSGSGGAVGSGGTSGSGGALGSGGASLDAGGIVVDAGFPPDGNSPAALLGLTTWKLELPAGTALTAPQEVKLKDGLGSYSSEYFNLNLVAGQATGVNFRGIAGGALVGATPFARSELREQDATGDVAASWTCAKAVRTMHLEQTLKRTTQHKPEVAIGQIHDASNDLVLIKYAGPADAAGVSFGVANGTTDTGVISVRFNNDTTNVVLDPAYRLGQRMTVDIVANGDHSATVTYTNTVTGHHTDVPSYQLKGIVGTCYFKAGLAMLACSPKSLWWTTGAADNTLCAAKTWTADKWEIDPRADAVVEIHKLAINPLPP